MIEEAKNWISVFGVSDLSRSKVGLGTVLKFVSDTRKKINDISLPKRKKGFIWIEVNILVDNSLVPGRYLKDLYFVMQYSTDSDRIRKLLKKVDISN
jgi:hypothetical protein